MQKKADMESEILAARKVAEVAEDHQREHMHPHEHSTTAGRVFGGLAPAAARKSDVITLKCQMNGMGEWAVVGPNERFRVAANIDFIADTIRMVIADYGDYCRSLVTKGQGTPNT